MFFSSPGELYFKCTACRRHLAAEQAAVGRLVECPGCRASLLVPAHSTVWPPALRKFLWLSVTHGLVIATLTGVGVYALTDRSVALRQERAARVAVTPATQLGNAETTVSARTEAVKPLRMETPDAAWQAEHRVLKEKYEELGNWVLSNMRGKFLLKEKLVKNIQLSPVTDDYLVHPDLAEYLNLNAKEQDLLDDAFGFGLSSLAELESRFLTVTQSAPDRAVAQIAPFETDGEAMRADLYRAMETVLGAQRFGQLLAAGEKDLAKRYHYFGNASRSMVFQQTASTNSAEAPYLVIRDGWIIPEGQGRRSIQVEESSVRSLPRDYMPYLSRLPGFVANYAQP